MKGFDPHFSDLPDYILKCTAMIWEGRKISALNWHYGDDLIVRTPACISRGKDAGKANTMATLAEFPDRQLLRFLSQNLMSVDQAQTMILHQRKRTYSR